MKDAVCAAMQRAELTLDELWLAYANVGGDLSKSELEAAVVGSAPLSAFQYNLIATGLNEHLKDHPGANGDPPWLPCVDEG